MQNPLSKHSVRARDVLLFAVLFTALATVGYETVIHGASCVGV